MISTRLGLGLVKDFPSSEIMSSFMLNVFWSIEFFTDLSFEKFIGWFMMDVISCSLRDIWLCMSKLVWLLLYELYEESPCFRKRVSSRVSRWDSFVCQILSISSIDLPKFFSLWLPASLVVVFVFQLVSVGEVHRFLGLFHFDLLPLAHGRVVLGASAFLNVGRFREVVQVHRDSLVLHDRRESAHHAFADRVPGMKSVIN